MSNHCSERLAIVIPAYNEAASIAGVIADVKAHAPWATVIVVDDTSTDGTAGIARKAGAIVLPLSIHLGAWGAMQAGIRYAERHRFGRVVTMDADGQHLAAELPGLVAHLDAPGINVVIGAYPERGSRARRLAWSFFRLLTGFSYQDLTSGFRAYDRAAMVVVGAREASLLDYQDVGVLLLLRKAGLQVVEHSVQMRPRIAGASHIFNSWLAVGMYMFETVIMSCARWHVHRFVPVRR